MCTRRGFCWAIGTLVRVVSAMVTSRKKVRITASDYTSTPEPPTPKRPVRRMPSVYLFATLDTKGAEADFVRSVLKSCDVAVTLVDVGSLGAPAVQADISRERIFELAGSSLDAVRQRADRGDAVTLAAAGAAALARSAYEAGDLSGV